MASHLRGACIFAVIAVVLGEAIAARGECPKNEEWKDCGTPCPKTCKNYKLQIMCKAACVKGCFCKRGLVRNDDGKCVRPSQCPDTTCPVNEVYKECGTACPRTCANYRAQIKCTAQCKRGCFCKDGLIRNDYGKCVKPEQCVPPICPKNEEYTECVPCANSCAYFRKEIACAAVCLPGCTCKRGLLRNDDGICVPADQCVPQICSVNEEFSVCGSACEPNCQNFRTDVSCIESCQLGCFCKPGFLRNKNRVCVRPEQCYIDTRCPANEVYNECGTACPRTCANYGALIKCTAECKKGCFCKDGLVRDDYGKCVKPEQCVPGGCSPDRVYTSCVNPCNDCYRKGVCEGPYDCVAGCDCPPGQYMFGYSGTCIPEEQCPIVDCPANEIYKDCGSACPPTCKTYNRTDIACIQVCRQGCFCKNGYVRNDDGICVKPEQCYPDQCPENEEYQSCGTACPQTCKNYGIRISCVDVCVKGCFCKKGFVRNDDGICIEPDQCVPGGCPLNEQYSSCVDICNDCSIVGACNFLVCNRGCDCIPGYTRSAQNKICIPKYQCPENNCPVNEVYSECVIPCNDCYTKGDCEFLLCNKGCDCRKGYYRDEYTRRCIPESKCPLSEDWFQF